MNGQSTTTSNGESHTNGSAKSLANMSYYGHKREEVTRIIMQSLYEMGYGGAASMLSAESGYQLETAGVATFRSAVLGGRWSEAERILIQSFRNGGAHNAQKSSPDEKTLLLAEDADRSKMLFYLREHKFLELLEAGDLGAALIVLRQELTPLNYNVERLHALSRCVDTDDLTMRSANVPLIVFSCAPRNCYVINLDGTAPTAYRENGFSRSCPSPYPPLS